MNFWTGIILSTLCLVATIIIFATKFLFPYHRVVALLIYAIGWIPFIYSISLRKKWILQHEQVVTTFFQAYWVHIVYGIIAVVVLNIFLILFPVTKSPFSGLSDKEISLRLKEDETIILYLDNKLSINLNKARQEKTFSLDFKQITGTEKQKLKNFWISYIEVLLEMDLMKERYKTFYQLNIFTKKNLHKQAFENGYVAFLAQHYYMLELTKLIQNSDIITFLNEEMEDHGIQKDTFDMLEQKLTISDELIRLNTGRAYYSLIKNGDSKLNILADKYLKGIDKSLKTYAHLIADRPLKFLEKKSFNLWFPIQKKSAIEISYIKTSNRDYHIGPNLIKQYKEKLLPGDILLERREWHATNVGIPGFWSHTALYIGTLKDMNNYFKNIPELKGKTFEQFISNNYVNAYKKLLKKDENNYEYAVIESKRPGVILTSLECTTNADSLAILRVKNTNRSDHFKIVTQALDYLGKPYDFDFNFVTDNALVCSELVYKAYMDIAQINLKLQKINGRTIISPNQYAEKFTAEYGSKEAELDLILFLDGNEKKRVAVEKNAEEFAKTWQRPKWHIAKDFINFE